MTAADCTDHLGAPPDVRGAGRMCRMRRPRESSCDESATHGATPHSDSRCYSQQNSRGGGASSYYLNDSARSRSSTLNNVPSLTT
jgi:hypothetical protein